jgi:hypothetical protein
MADAAAPYLAAVGILTQWPDGPLERRMWRSLSLAPAEAILLRYAVFQDEFEADVRKHPGAAATRRRAARASQVAVLARPRFVGRSAQYECIAKILAWLQHSTATIQAAYVAWMDRDTWLMPLRLQTFLEGVQGSTARNESARAWIGTFMHWSRFD